MAHAPAAPTATPAPTTASAPAKKGLSFNFGLAITLASLAVILFIAYTVAEKKGLIEGGYSELPHPTGTREREVREAILKRQEIETKNVPERIIKDGDDSAITDFKESEGAKQRRLNLLEGDGTKSKNNNPPPPPTATCNGREVLPGNVLKLEIPASCRNEFQMALVNTDVQRVYKVEFTSGGYTIATDPPFEPGRATEFSYDSATHILQIQGDLFFHHKPEDFGKQATITLTPIS